MTIDFSVGTVGAACAVATLTGKIVHSLFAGALEKRDSRIEALEKAVADKDRELEGAFKVVKDTQKLLFEKLDSHYKELQDYKLSVAKEYVATGALKELLAPIVTRLDSIEHDLRNGTTGRGS